MDVEWFIRNLEFYRDTGNHYADVKLRALNFGHFVRIFCNFQEAVTRKPYFRRHRFSKMFFFYCRNWPSLGLAVYFSCTMYKASSFVDVKVDEKQEKHSSVTVVNCSPPSLDVTNCVLSRVDCFGDCNTCKAQEHRTATWTCWHVDG